MNNISTNPYKGVRDFYPQDWLFQKWLFWKMAEVCELYGYQNYNASPLEATELFEAKSGKEIIENETYNLRDRGDRRVTLRPEMTPTVARMIAAKGPELPKPIRWYSIPNVFRYEKPQKGRLREHYQLNVDLFGIKDIEAEIEVIELGYKIMKNIGASNEDFVVKVNNRKIINPILKKYSPENSHSLAKIIDKKAKLSAEDFKSEIHKVVGEKSIELLEILEKKNISDFKNFANPEDIEKTEKLISKLKKSGTTNIIFDITLMRGFDYYTGIVFEFFDTSPENNRSLFGGGRYDNLLDIFGKEKVPAVGFGMGDVTAKDFLETRDKIPDLKSQTQVAILPLSEDFLEGAKDLSRKIRDSGVNTELDLSFRKIVKQINSAEKKKIENIIIIGEEESKNQKYNLKNIFTGKTLEKLNSEEIIKKLIEFQEK